MSVKLGLWRGESLWDGAPDAEALAARLRRDRTQPDGFGPVVVRSQSVAAGSWYRLKAVGRRDADGWWTVYRTQRNGTIVRGRHEGTGIYGVEPFDPAVVTPDPG